MASTLRGLGLLVVVVVSLAAIPSLVVHAAHGEPANFTVEPATQADRQPGIDDASYKSWTASKPDANGRKSFKYLEYSVLEWDEGRLGNCGPADSKVAGIDRGNDDPGTHVDDDIRDNIEGQPVSNEDKVVIDFIDPEDPVGEPVHLNVSDEFVSHLTDCRGNPSDPGWYQLRGTINGTTYDGEHAEYSTTSHYFYICDCASYDEATDQLGPPPSKQDQGTPTATPTATATVTPERTATRTPPATGTPFPSPTATATGTPSPSRTATRTQTATPQPGDPTATPTPTAAAWAANTPAQPGFGPVVALAAVLIAILVHRRS